MRGNITHGFGGGDGAGLGGADIDCGCDHDFVDQSQHEHSQNDADHDYYPGVTAEALMDCYDHSHMNFGYTEPFAADYPADGSDFGHAGYWSGLDSSGMSFDDRLQMALSDSDRRYFGAHGTGHGPIDLIEKFGSLATQAGLIRVCSRMPNLKPVDLSVSDNDISDWGHFRPPYTRQHTPNGYYEGADGLTWVFKQSWQLTDAKKGFDRSQGTYLEVRIITWFFASIGDYETRVDINIKSTLGYGLQNAGRAIYNHQLAGAKVCSGLLNAMKAATPSTLVQEKRIAIALQARQPQAVDDAEMDLEQALVRFRNQTRTESYKPANWFDSNVEPVNTPREQLVGVLVAIPAPRDRHAS